ncbi:hypothetical protein FISHEDRAFT_57572 [Fistulina hepatica ATCC 64428]|uniref:Uncharacterized protein n=1 Tax=Fistulina hepatica ATCC 64428 TaxID=1128425 RepID=A0A0D7AG10_9AGAR|nr:hypothetical protein FISHEDRAFT_57572 [Fistulina hepatica ATCC 64428]
MSLDRYHFARRSRGLWDFFGRRRRLIDQWNITRVLEGAKLTIGRDESGTLRARKIHPGGLDSPPSIVSPNHPSQRSLRLYLGRMSGVNWLDANTIAAYRHALEAPFLSLYYPQVIARIPMFPRIENPVILDLYTHDTFRRAPQDGFGSERMGLRGQEPGSASA